jgi:hypothetical protein
MPKTVTDHIRNHLLVEAGVGTCRKVLDYDELVRDIWDLPVTQRFLFGMRSRLIMGRFRYGNPLDALPKEIVVNEQNAREAISRIETYLETGNLEVLFDAANFCLIEFLNSRHPEKHLTIAKHEIRRFPTAVQTQTEEDDDDGY